MSKIPKPVRPTVPRNVGYYTPPAGQSLSKMAAQIGRDRALAGFYEAITHEQWDYDQDVREEYFRERTDRRQHRQSIDRADHREYLQSGPGGLGNKSKASFGPSNPAGVETSEAREKILSMLNPWHTEGDPDPEVAKADARDKEREASEEREADFWHEIKDAVSSSFDAATPDVVTDKIASGAKAVANSPVGQAAGEGLMWTLDKLSRPVSAVAGGMEGVFEMNEDAGKKSKFESYTDMGLAATQGPLGLFTGMLGGNVFDSFDDIDTDAIKNIGSKISDGWSGNGGHFSDVIRTNALADGSSNVFDKPGYQALMGLSADVALDPLNLVGLGIVRKPAAALSAAKRTTIAKKRSQDLWNTSNEVAATGVPKVGNVGSADELYTPEEIYEILGGHRRPTTKAEKVQHLKDTQAGLDFIERRMGANAQKMNRVGSREKKLESLRAKYQADLDKMVKQDTSDSAAEKIVLDVAQREAKGEIPKGTAAEIKQRVEFATVNNAFKGYYNPKSGKTGDFDAFEDALGEGWKNNPLLTRADREKVFKDVNANIKNSEHEGVYAKVSQARKQESSLKTALKTEESKAHPNPQTVLQLRDQISKAEAFTKKSQYEANVARNQVFIRSANAVIARKMGAPTWRKDGNYGDFGGEADHIRLVAEQARSIIERAGAVPVGKGKKRYIENEVDNLKGGSTTGVGNSEHYSDVGDVDLFGEDVFVVKPGDFDEVTRAEKVLKVAEEELARYSDDLAPGNWTSLDVPTKLLGLDGNISRDILDDLLVSRIDNKGNQHYEFKPTGDPEADKFLQGFAGNFNREYKAEVKRLTKNSTRRAEETNLKNARAKTATIDKIHGYPNSWWASRNPDGMSSNDFVTKVMEADSVQKLRILLDGAPVNVAIKDMKEIPGLDVNPKLISRNMGGKDGWKTLYYNARDIDYNGNPVPQTEKFFKARERLDKALEGAGYPRNTKQDVLLDAWAKDIKEYYQNAWQSDFVRAFGKDGDAADAVMRTRIDNAARDVNAPVGMSLDEIRANKDNKFVAALIKELQRNSRVELSKKFTQAMSQQRKTATKIEQAVDKPKLASEQMDEIYEQAKDTILEKMSKDMDSTAKIATADDAIGIPSAPLDASEVSTISKQVAKENADNKIDDLKVKQAEAKSSNNKVEVAKIQHQINRVREALKAENARYDAYVKQAREESKVLKNRMREEAILRIADESIAKQTSKLSLNLIGKEMPIAGSQLLFKSAEAASGLPVLRQFSKVYAEAILRPSSRLPQEMALSKHRAVSNSSEIISLHLKELDRTLGRKPMSVRQSDGNSYINFGPIGEGEEQIGKFFEGLMPFFDDTYGLKVQQVAAYLPDEMVPSSWDDIDSPVELAKRLTDTLSASRNGKKVDPIEVIHATRIAGEKALAKKTLIHSINEVFGVRRLVDVDYKTGKAIVRKDGKPSTKGDPETAKVVEELGKLGWQSHPAFGNTHYFPPEVTEDLGRLMDMLKPANSWKVNKLIDEVTGMWKTGVTIYNPPAYHFRNAIGEVMSAWLGGVDSVVPYRKARHVARFLSKESHQLEAFRQQNPQIANLIESNSDRGKKIAVTMSDGRTISTEQLALLYRDQGLSTGFINNEYRHLYSKLKERVRSIPGVRKAGQANQKWRAMNETYEDYFRIAHFIDAMEKAPKSMSVNKAAENAAAQVRKYHFDYTDFTSFEKKTMLRAFPFYKWTRKAMPLMVSQLFVNPGKMMMYPKAMNAAQDYSASLNSDDFIGERQGAFTPTYVGMVPAWVQGNMAYQVGGPVGMGKGEEGSQQYLNVATPQMDALKNAFSPVNAMTNLMNPLIKVPIEQAEGETMGDRKIPLDEGDDRLRNLLAMFPMAANVTNAAKGEMKPDKLVRLLTGLGIYNVDEFQRNKG